LNCKATRHVNVIAWGRSESRYLSDIGLHDWKLMEINCWGCDVCVWEASAPKLFLFRSCFMCGMRE